MKSINTAIPIAMAMSVLSVRCTTTLSMMAWVSKGTPSASNWMMSEALSTSRHTGLCLRSSGTNQPKPKPCFASLAASGSFTACGAGAKR